MIGLRKTDDIRELRPRFQAMVLVVCAVFLALIGRLGQLQVLEGDHYSSRAERNFVDVVDVEAPRGRIFDKDGNPLATNRPAYTLYIIAHSRVMEEDIDGEEVLSEDRKPIPDRVVDLLLSVINIVDDHDREKLVGRIHQLRANPKKGRYAAPVRRNLTWEEFARIQTRAQELSPWVDIRESSIRYYPEGELTAFVTGYVGQITREMLKRHSGYRMGDRVGRTGIERQWENYLRGRLGSRSRVTDSLGREVKEPPAEAVEALPLDRDPIPGQDIYLTIDLDLQKLAHDTMSDVPAGALVALEADSGRIIAMVSVPAIDPNRRQQPISREEYTAWAESPLKPFVDKTVQEHFFPGSTYKVVSVLAALSDPEFDPEEEIECEGYVKYGKRRFRDTHRHGPINLEQAIVQSCNVYFYQLAIDRTLSLARMEQFARSLGLGERTGLGLNGEVKGRIPTEAFEAREGTYQKGVRLNSAIGQGNVNVTVLQLATLYGAIANGGELMTPYIVDRIQTHEGKLVFSSQPQPARGERVISYEDRQRIHKGLVGVVNDELGTAYSERLENVLVAGKTGTAQVGREARKKEDDNEIEGWDTTKDHAWFAAYAPAEDPRIVVVAFVEHGGTGADAAAPIAMKVIDHYLGATSEGERRPRGPGVPPPLPGTREPQKRSRVEPPPGSQPGGKP